MPKELYGREKQSESKKNQEQHRLQMNIDPAPLYVQPQNYQVKQAGRRRQQPQKLQHTNFRSFPLLKNKQGRPGIPGPALVLPFISQPFFLLCSNTCLPTATIEAMSVTLVGMIMLLLVLASLPNSPR